MIINPAIIALTCGALVTAGYALYAAFQGRRIWRHWDLSSGSAGQLQLERRTYLITTLMIWLLSYEIFSLFLFIHTADHLHPMFIGAMCATGSLNVGVFGYPALIVKILAVLGCGVWLLINHADNQAEDYPLIRLKYKCLAGLTSLLVLDAVLQTAYFGQLVPQVITSCCNTIFNSEGQTIAGEIAALPVPLTRAVFFFSAVCHASTAIHFLKTGRSHGIFGWLSFLYFGLFTVAVITFISTYYYELPTHHCPFCLLQAEYRYIGYPLYAGMFLCAIFGMATGFLAPFSTLPSLASTLAPLLRRYTWISLTASLFVLIIVVYPMIFSDFILLP